MFAVRHSKIKFEGTSLGVEIEIIKMGKNSI